jgi:nucleoside-diphosphate-sugar epimerase
VTSFLHVADAAQAALAALAWPAGPLNIVDDAPAAGMDWLPVYASLVGAPPPVRLGAPGWERGASNARARQRGWRPQYPTWRDGFTEVLASGRSLVSDEHTAPSQSRIDRLNPCG